VAGVILEKPARGKFRRLSQVAILTALTGALLIAADYRTGAGHTLADLGWRAGLGIGLAQAFALFPGVSRSGITITAGVFLGLSIPGAVEFSFLLAAPILAGAGPLVPSDAEAQAAVGRLLAARHRATPRLTRPPATEIAARIAELPPDSPPAPPPGARALWRPAAPR
jgi:undecaprenyl pyrophosphate phosphatase UppP